MSRRLLQHHLSDVGCVHRRPANPFEPNVGPAMLGLGDVGRSDAEALVAEARRGDANAVEVARGKTRRASEADKQAVDVGAFAAQLFRRQHRLDVARAAAARRGDALRVRDEPIVDRARLLKIGLRAGHDPVGSLLDDSVGWDERGRLGEKRALFGREGRGVALPRADIDRAVARRHTADDLCAASARARAPGEMNELERHRRDRGRFRRNPRCPSSSFLRDGSSRERRRRRPAPRSGRARSSRSPRRCEFRRRASRRDQKMRTDRRWRGSR